MWPGCTLPRSGDIIEVSNAELAGMAIEDLKSLAVSVGLVLLGTENEGALVALIMSMAVD